jgi:AcrR family transcriptional regulator
MASTGSASRAETSRRVLLLAFNELFTTTRYADFGVAQIVRRADVSRSTFYKHFKSKDDLLRKSLGSVVSPLAAACEADYEANKLTFVLEHFRENRSRALGLLNGPSAQQVITLFTCLIEEHLAARTSRHTQTSLSLIAGQIAESQLGLIRVWLTRGGVEPANEVAAALVAGTQALVEALV